MRAHGLRRGDARLQALVFEVREGECAHATCLFGKLV